jgi:hypothetical protein
MKSLLNFLFNRPKPIQDALLDTRSPEDKAKDYLDIEFAYGTEDYDWKEETTFVDTPFFPHNQAMSLSCVALSWVIWLEEFWARAGRQVVTSRKDGYFWRWNKPSGGMTADDSIRMARRGIALESQVPSQGLGETAMNTPYALTQEILRERAKNKIKAGVYITQCRDIDAIAKASRHSPVSLFVFFDTPLQWQEWWTTFPKVLKTVDLYAPATSRHHISVPSSLAYKVEGGVLINGVKHIKIQDSAQLGSGRGRHGNVRYLSEDFIKTRCYTAYYAIPDDSMIKANPPKKKIVWDGKRNLRVGMVGDDVKKLQQILQIKGFFNFPNPTGYFGGITRRAVIDYQNANADTILKPLGLKSGTGFVGLSTRAQLEKDYS